MIIDVGGIRIGLSGMDPPLEAQVRSRYQPFLSDGPADFRLSLTVRHDAAHAPIDPRVTPEGDGVYAVRYGMLVARLDLASGRGDAEVLPTWYIVDSLLRITTTLLALERGALLVHASGVRVGERVLVCFGPSGVGKTTVARSVERADVLCDEMMMVWADGRAAGTPFHGDLPHCAPGAGELMALVRLAHADRDALQPLSTAQAARALLGSVLFFCSDDRLAERLLDLALRISAGRTYSLSFRQETHVPTFVDEHLRRYAA